jgi:hypothetical protein
MEDVMVQQLDDLEMVSDVGPVVGKYAGPSDVTFECDEGKYGKEGRDTYLAVKYDEIEKSLGAKMSKWNTTTKWSLSWTGLRNNAEGVLHNAKGADGWAFLKITKGG